MFRFVYADEDGNGYTHDYYLALGRLGNMFVEPAEGEMIPLPKGASLTLIPDRTALVLNQKGEFKKYPGSGYAMGALLPQGYTRTLLPAFVNDSEAKGLPLFGYAAVAVKDNEFYVAAIQTDEDEKWNPKHYNTEDLEERVRALQAKFPQNRLLKQLGHCALTYGCFTAQNIFYCRWEGGLPVSPACNAQCLGCISLQPSECCPSPQTRLDFVPTVQEGVEVALHHLQHAEDGIISFGQGCEGDPSLQGDLIAQIITEVRKVTSKGTINMNTNAGNTEGIKKICDAGIDSLRVSLNSGTDEVYKLYYQPKNYTLDNVRQSLRYAADKGIYTYLNLLTFPGINDCEGEIESLINLVDENDVKAIQIRNLNIDPDTMRGILDTVEGEPLGIPDFLAILEEHLPNVDLGNYSKPLR